MVGEKGTAPSAPGLREEDGAAFRADRLGAGPRGPLSWDGGERGCGARRDGAGWGWGGGGIGLELGFDLAFYRQRIAVLPGEPELAGLGGADVELVLVGDEPEDDAEDAAAHVDAARADAQLGGHVLDGAGRGTAPPAGAFQRRGRSGVRLIGLVRVGLVVAVRVVGHGESLPPPHFTGDVLRGWSRALALAIMERSFNFVKRDGDEVGQSGQSRGRSWGKCRAMPGDGGVLTLRYPLPAGRG